MKKLLILLYLISAALPVTAQNYQEWFQQKQTKKKYMAEQIIALQAYGTVLKKGYKVSQQGLGLIHTIKSGDYSQNKDHFQSFSNLNPELKNHSDTRQLIALAEKIQQISTQSQQQLRSRNQLNVSEESVVSHVFLNIQKETAQLLSELQTLLQNGSLSLSDSERIKRLEQIHLHMQSIYSYTVRFGLEAIQLSIHREQESNAINQVRIYHTLDHL